jgi:hypothetical protein
VFARGPAPSAVGVDRAMTPSDPVEEGAPGKKGPAGRCDKGPGWE